MKTLPLLILLAFLESGAQAPRPHSGTIQYFPDFESQYVKARPVAVWLPEGYSEKQTYDVLYMHDGQSLFDASITWNRQEWRADETAGRLQQENRSRPFIIVAIWSLADQRFRNYFPQKAFESLTPQQQAALYAMGKEQGQALFGGAINSDAYLRFIVKELMPFVLHTYSVKAGKEYTFMAGSSMGGLISMYALCEYPDVFGGAACLSTHGPGTFETQENPVPAAFMDYLKRNLPSPMTHKFYFDFGDQALDAGYGPFQQQADLIAMAKGYDAGNWMSKKFPGADHSEQSWAERFELPLLFLLGR